MKHILLHARLTRVNCETAHDDSNEEKANYAIRKARTYNHSSDSQHT